MSRIIQTISVPLGGKAAELIEDMKRNGKNVSQTVCDILARHGSIYDDNVQMEMELNQLRYRYAIVCKEARTALERSGEKWELYFPPDGWNSEGMQEGENYGLGSRVHFRRVDTDQ